LEHETSPATSNRFYDEFAGEYHFIFEDWEASIARQAAAMSAILERAGISAPNATVLDCACGIGTQALGLAKLGFRVTGSDLSPGAIARARSEAAVRGLNIPFFAADMRNLDAVPGSGFDALICMDNALPHLLSEHELALAAASIHRKLRDGGVFLAGIRDYDEILRQRPPMQGPAFYRDGGRRRIVFQVWDWHDERRYTFHMYVTRETDTGWTNFHGAGAYRALLREELTHILASSGFTNIRWHFPSESGLYLPILTAVR
jgi:glycine/sarcosine N-methyltransferase